MKTISGQIISTKEVSLSKAAKVLSKFVSAENGSSQAISAYLHRASTAFNELNQLHKDLKSSSSHRKHKSHKIENVDQDNEKSSQTVLKSSQVDNPNASIGSQAGNGDGSEKHKNKKKQQEVDYTGHGDGSENHKNKKKQQEVYYPDHGDGSENHKNKKKQQEGAVKVPTETQNAMTSSRVEGHEGEGFTGMEERKIQKKEKKKKKKDKEGASNFFTSKSEVENLEVESATGDQDATKREKELGNNMEGENGWLVDPQETQIKKKKSGATTEIGLYDEEAKTVQKKKRKNLNEEDGSGYVSNKRLKRKHDGDS